jgi:hypothetical protein
MKRTIGIALVSLTLFPTVSFAQTRPRTATRTSTKRNARKASASKLADVVRTQGAGRIADQIKLLTRFIYVLGGVARGLEAADEAARRNEASPAALAKTASSKATIRKSLQDWRDIMDKLELDFRTTPELERYYTELAGVAAAAATAEDQAARNQFDQAGRTLLGVVNQLTDVLLDMR